MKTEDRLKRILNAYDGTCDREFAIFSNGTEWGLSIGPLSTHVMLGECSGDCEFEAETLDECLRMAEERFLISND